MTRALMFVMRGGDGSCSALRRILWAERHRRELGPLHSFDVVGAVAFVCLAQNRVNTVHR